ncbi:GNAT family N-acetyltransferase [Pseudorhodobacter sp. MZDSW-24AT]|uniref:GNAT family N-acetyltransferase n=1 Tax=Pseudorhodobacter sp. MZDSW-24AT TaxID=2052957 RepID=UPI000C1EFE78|nr:GNAT family protein [Pseudorhodobacter sp. MZDSW-24AT]PJF10881.1 N-acetyltransferase [Pseudorhodobacter sp. MZDSW-24AT]
MTPGPGPDRITTARLTLRRAAPEDLDDLHRILSDPQAMAFWGDAPSASRHHSAKTLRGLMEWQAKPDVSDEYVLDHGGRVIGKAGLWQVPEVGFFLHPDHWRQGLMAEALRALIPHWFARHAVPALTADVDPDNAACLGLLTRLGFHETHRAKRTLLIAGRWCDSVYLSLPRP